MAITSWAVIPGELGKMLVVKEVPRNARSVMQYGTTIPGNATGVIPLYGQIFPRGKT